MLNNHFSGNEQEIENIPGTFEGSVENVGGNSSVCKIIKMFGRHE